MARVYVEQQAVFECPDCGEESRTDPGATEGKTVVCGVCGRSHRVGEVGYMELDWNKLNRANATAKARPAR